jgi:hypothetical protein
MIVDKYGIYVRKCMWQLRGQDRVNILICNFIKKDQMHVYEMSYKCQRSPTHTVAISYIVAILIHNHFESPNTIKE